MLQLIYQLIICLGAEKEMKKVTLQHVLGNKILEYDVDDRGVIIDEREKDRYAKQQDSKEKLMSNWIKEHIVFYYDVKKQGATNETLKESAYLQDLSGKGRRMKLNNFLFAEMSGVGGYNDNFKNWALRSVAGTVDLISSSQIILRKFVSKENAVIEIIPAKRRAFLKCNIEGITEELKGKIRLRYHTEAGYRDKILENGYFEFDSNIESDNSGFVGFISTELIDNCNITITQIPEYPGALVTDGVDDYGLVENLSSGVKMLFMTVNPMISNIMLYDQRFQIDELFQVYSFPNRVAYILNINNSEMNKQGKVYINGKLNTTIVTNDLLNVKHIVTVTANDLVTVKKRHVFFNSSVGITYYAKLAFYNSIAFDSIPTEADGFTEQELIDYVIDKYELK